MTAMPSARTRFQGARDIVRYNGAVYAAAAGLATALFALAASGWVGGPLRAGVFAGAALIVLATAASVVASHHIHDRSPLHTWTWLTRRLNPLRSWTVVHAGLDEASPALSGLYVGAKGTTLDVFDGHRMTEPSIRVARAAKGHAGIKATFDRLPVASGSQDLVMLFFCAHELRNEADRTTLLRETGRLLRDGGRVVLVEHLLGPANLAVFGPGAFHFFSRSTWLRSVKDAGLGVHDEHGITAFVRAFHLVRRAA